jgi:hypothetical protein
MIVLDEGTSHLGSRKQYQTPIHMAAAQHPGI